MNTEDLEPITDAERERIRETWPTVFVVNHKSKHHLQPTCRRLKNADAADKPISVYPGDHLDLCPFCVARWRRWHRAFYGYRVESDAQSESEISSDIGSEQAAQEFLQRVNSD